MLLNKIPVYFERAGKIHRIDGLKCDKLTYTSLERERLDIRVFFQYELSNGIIERYKEKEENTSIVKVNSQNQRNMKKNGKKYVEYFGFKSSFIEGYYDLSNEIKSKFNG
jgi:hypothetical protein